MDLHLNQDLENAVILIEMQKGNALYIFIDDEFIKAVDNHKHTKGNITLLAFLGTILASQHTLLILLESLGYHNLIGRWGADTKVKTKGITGDIVISGNHVHDYDTHHFITSIVDGGSGDPTLACMRNSV